MSMHKIIATRITLWTAEPLQASHFIDCFLILSHVRRASRNAGVKPGNCPAAAI